MANQEEIKPLVDHLFRYEAGKLVSVLTRIFGPHNLELAEDVVQDTLIKAMESWRIHGVPNNPTAWIFTAARNKALDVVRRRRHEIEFAEEISPLLKSEYSAGAVLNELLNENDIEDEQLRMMFVCCHPAIAEEGQVALILKTLCGFSIAEIARAFLTNEETIGKRLYRARQQFREEKIAFAMPEASAFPSRLHNVLIAIYLIFNEGYNSTNHTSAIRDDLVEEALRLARMLSVHPLTRQADVLALLALLCFHAARLYGRVDDEGNLLALRDQNRKLWNKPLIEQGAVYLRQASVGENVSPYHIEAAIAYEHCIAIDMKSTDWKRILQLYDWLYKIEPQPLVSLNRLIAFAEVNGPVAALAEATLLHDERTLQNYYLYPAAMGDWYAQTNSWAKARELYARAMTLTQSEAEKKFLQKKIDQMK